MFAFYIVSLKPYQAKYSILFSRRKCNLAENNLEKLKNLENLNFNLPRYHYPDSLINQRLQTAPSVTRKDLQKPNESSNENERLGYNL